MKDSVLSQGTVLQATYDAAILYDSAAPERLLFLLKAIEDPELLLSFLEGLDEPLDAVAFFVYGAAPAALAQPEAASLEARFGVMAAEGLRVYVTDETCCRRHSETYICCSMRDLPLLIRDADKVISL